MTSITKKYTAQYNSYTSRFHHNNRLQAFNSSSCIEHSNILETCQKIILNMAIMYGGRNHEKMCTFTQLSLSGPRGARCKGQSNSKWGQHGTADNSHSERAPCLQCGECAGAWECAQTCCGRFGSRLWLWKHMCVSRRTNYMYNSSNADWFHSCSEFWIMREYRFAKVRVIHSQFLHWTPSLREAQTKAHGGSPPGQGLGYRDRRLESQTLAWLTEFKGQGRSLASSGAQPRLQRPMFSPSFSLFPAGLHLLSGFKVLVTASVVPLMVASNCHCHKTSAFTPHCLGKGKPMLIS